jgi:hypothetical protein
MMKKLTVFAIVLVGCLSAKAQNEMTFESAKMSQADAKKVIALAKKLDAKSYQITLTEGKKTTVYGGLNASSIKQGSTTISELPQAQAFSITLCTTLRNFIVKPTADQSVVKQLQAMAEKYKN